MNRLVISNILGAQAEDRKPETKNLRISDTHVLNYMPIFQVSAITAIFR